MVNKIKGSRFEKDFAQILSDNGFWVRLDKGMAQTCDLFGAKDNEAYLFECKTCKTDYFDITRVRTNQKMSKLLFEAMGNFNHYYVYKVNDLGIFLSHEPISKPSMGLELEVWLDSILG
jgi:hypothetical protein